MSCLLWLAAIVMSSPGSSAAETTAARPNFLWITCEDISPLLGCYGDRFAVTPNLDRLAAEGVRYRRAFAVASVCSPARSCLITGVYPTSLGTQHLRNMVAIPRDIRPFPSYLRRAGYYCTNNVKEDYNFKTPADVWDESSRQAHWRKRRPGQPFFSVFNITTTHQGQIRLPDQQFARRTARLSPSERHDPAQVPLPPYYPDTPVVRRDMARLYDLITAMDKQAGELMRQLEEDGLADETIVFFFSDHGCGLPRHKRWLYDSGIRVPLIIRFPEKYRHWAPAPPGSVVDRLVSFVDFAPTMLSLAGVPIPEYMQGTAFLGPRAGDARRYVFAVRDRVDEVYELSRAVRDRRYLYIRNYMPHRPVMQLSWYSEQTPTRRELRRLARDGQLHGPQAILVQPTKPLEELYDAEADPWMIRNLAASPSPEYQSVLQRMRTALRRWILETRDTGFLHEAEMHRRAAGTTVWHMARHPARYPLEEILAAADLVGRGTAARKAMIAALDHSDPAVRFWAATALVSLGAEARPAAEKLIELLDDPAPTVRVAAAEALAQAGVADQALEVLAQALQHPDGWVRLQAANALQYLGQRAAPVRQSIEQTWRQPGQGQAGTYVRWGLSHLLDELGHRP